MKGTPQHKCSRYFMPLLAYMTIWSALTKQKRVRKLPPWTQMERNYTQADRQSPSLSIPLLKKTRSTQNPATTTASSPRLTKCSRESRSLMWLPDFFSCRVMDSRKFTITTTCPIIVSWKKQNMSVQFSWMCSEKSTAFTTRRLRRFLSVLARPILSLFP